MGRLTPLVSSLRAELGSIDEAVALIEATASRKRALSATAKSTATLRKKMASAFVRQGTDFLTRFKSLKRTYEAAGSSYWLTLRPNPDGFTSYLFEAARSDEWGPLWDATAQATLIYIREPIQTAAEEAMLAAMGETSAYLDVSGSFDLTDPRAAAYLKEHGARQVTKINDTTRAELRTLLSKSNEEGWSYQRTAREIRGSFNGFAGKSPLVHIRDRATLVAVTEIGNAYEEGSRVVAAGLQDRGLQMEKRWNDAGDARVHPGCRADSAAGWIPLNNRFPSGAMQPLDHPGCRCYVIYRRVRTNRPDPTPVAA